MRPASYVPESKRIDDLLPEMQKVFLSSCTPEQQAQWFELLASRKQEDIEKDKTSEND